MIKQRIDNVLESTRLRGWEVVVSDLVDGFPKFHVAVIVIHWIVAIENINKIKILLLYYSIVKLHFIFFENCSAMELYSQSVDNKKMNSTS